MADRRAFIVTGAMSSGTRMLVHAVESVGFRFLRLEGHLDQEKIDSIDFPEDDPAFIVLHRTLPSGLHWPDFDLLTLRLEMRAYAVQPLMIRRDWHSTIHSQLYRALAISVEEAEAQLRQGAEIAGRRDCIRDARRTMMRAWPNTHWIKARRDEGGTTRSEPQEHSRSLLLTLPSMELAGPGPGLLGC